MKNELIKKLLIQLQKHFKVDSIIWKEIEYIKALIDDYEYDDNDLY